MAAKTWDVDVTVSPDAAAGLGHMLADARWAEAHVARNTDGDDKSMTDAEVREWYKVVVASGTSVVPSSLSISVHQEA